MKVVMKIVAVYQQRMVVYQVITNVEYNLIVENLKLGPYVEYPTLGDGNSTTGWCSINVSENDFEKFNNRK